MSLVENTNVSLLEQCLSIIRNSWSSESGWIKVHAAEALIELGEATSVYPEILHDDVSWNDANRIGKWRVLAACGDDQNRKVAFAKIEEAFIRTQYPLQLTALESLCKLRFVASNSAIEILRELFSRVSEPEAPFACWALQLSGSGGMEEKVAVLLLSPDSRMRKLAAFVLRWMNCKETGVLRSLAHAMSAESRLSPAYPFLLGVTLALDADPDHANAWQGEVRKFLKEGTNEGRYELCQALRNYFDQKDITALMPLLNWPDPDVRIAAALAIATIVGKDVASAATG